MRERDHDSEFELIDEHWEKYAADVANVRVWSETECRLAAGLVWNHVGRLNSGWGRPSSSDEADDYGDDDDPEIVEEHRQRARDCFAKAQAIAPEVLQIWQSLIIAAGIWGDVEGEIDAFLKLLQRFPDDLDSLTSAASLLMQGDRVPEALPLVERALRLKPLDESLREQVCAAHLGTARHLALKKDFPTARQHFDLAEKCCPTKAGDIETLARRSIFERKAGNLALAEELDDQTCRVNDDPTYALLQLLIESIRYQLPKPAVNRHEKDWQKCLGNKCSSQAAGKMAELLSAHLVSRLPYEGVTAHCILVARYLTRATLVKFERDHLRSVCEFFVVARSRLGPSIEPMEELKKAATRGQ